MQGDRQRNHLRLSIAASSVAFAFIAMAAIVPPAPASSVVLRQSYTETHAQTLSVSKKAEIDAEARDGYVATAGVEGLAAEGTNYAFAKMVMLFGGWPQSDANVTVMVRWMRQENGTSSWWNRNNPLNNGLGSGGGGGTGSYANLVIAAQKVAENLATNSVFNSIEADFASSASTATTESAIWASPWASSHYANGAHWHYTPVDVVQAPASAW